MDIISLSPYAILRLLRTQPDQYLECSANKVALSVAERYTQLVVASLRLITHYHSLTDEQEYLIEVLFLNDLPTTRPATFLSANNTKSAFHFQSNNPTLQKMPTTPLFPSTHLLHATCQIPISTLYLCTIEETRQLLSHHIPYLPPETFLVWTTLLKIAVKLTWPSPASLSYIAQSFPHESYTLEQQGLLTNRGYPTKTPPSEFAYQCYAFRNTIVLNAIFPYLASLCTWAASPAPSEPLQNSSMLTTPPPDFKSQTYHPKSPQSSPAEMLLRIRNDIENIQLAALSC